MAKVLLGRGYAWKQDENKEVWGTEEFLVAAKLEPVLGSEREVPDVEIDGNGRWQPDA